MRETHHAQQPAVRFTHPTAPGAYSRSALKTLLELGDHFALVHVFVDDPPATLVIAVRHRPAAPGHFDRQLQAAVPLLEFLGREHADAVFRPLQAVADLHPVSMGFMLLGRRLVVIIIHDHVKQAFDVMVVHDLVSLCDIRRGTRWPPHLTGSRCRPSWRIITLFRP